MSARMLAAALAAAALAAAGCGGSSNKEEKASQQVCDARADITKQVDTLKGLTAKTATTDQLRQSLTAISDDISKITSAQGDLSDSRKKQLESANNAFKAEVKDVATNLGSSVSIDSAKQQLTTAVEKLATSYQDALKGVTCS